MGDLSIKIKIGDREYPMKVKPEEEERVRLAGKLLNEKLKTFKEHFKIDDKQDLLSMVAFDVQATAALKEAEYQNLENQLEQRLNTLDLILTNTLKKH